MIFVGMFMLLTLVSNAWSEDNENVIQEPDSMESSDIQNDPESFEESQSSYADYEYNHETDTGTNTGTDTGTDTGTALEGTDDNKKVETDVNETDEEYSEPYEYYEYDNEAEEMKKDPNEKQAQSDAEDAGDADTWNAEFDNSEVKEY